MGSGRLLHQDFAGVVAVDNDVDAGGEVLATHAEAVDVEYHRAFRGDDGAVYNADAFGIILNVEDAVVILSSMLVSLLTSERVRPPSANCMLKAMLADVSL